MARPTANQRHAEPRVAEALLRGAASSESNGGPWDLTAATWTADLRTECSRSLLFHPSIPNARRRMLRSRTAELNTWRRGVSMLVRFFPNPGGLDCVHSRPCSPRRSHVEGDASHLRVLPLE